MQPFNVSTGRAPGWGRLLLIGILACSSASAPAQVSTRKTSALAVDADANGRINPGDTLRYTIVITNTSSSNLLNVQFTDTAFPNQTLVASSIKTTPQARPDSYTNVIGNTLYYVPASSGVLTNDSDADGDTVTAVAGTWASAHGGSVIMTNNGGFTFTPPVGYQGVDTFSYTNSDGKGGLGVGTVTLTISNMVWYVNNAGANGDGRQSSPFSSLAPLDGAGGAGDVDGANDYIYVFQGSGNYTAGIRLENGQRLIGAGVPLVVGGVTIYPAGTRPTLMTVVGNTNAITLAANNTVQGLNARSSTARAISGSNVGTLLITNVTASTSSTSTGDAVVYLDTGTVNVTLDSASATNSVGTGITLRYLSGSFVANAGTITNSTGTDFVVVGGDAAITYPGNLSDTSGRCVDISARTGGAITLSGNISSGGSGIIVQNNTGGSTTFSGASKALNTSTNTAVTLTSNTGHTINFTNGGLVIVATNGFVASGGAYYITVTGPGNTINSANGTALNVQNTTIGPAGLNFQSISSSGGSGSGIILNNPNYVGGLTVTGTGTPGSGGTIANKTGTDDNPSTGCGIYLNNAWYLALSSMQINDCANFGIRGTTVLDVKMTNLVVNGVNGTSTASREGSMVFDNAWGACTLMNSVVRGGIEDNLRVENDNGAPSTFLVYGCTIGNNSTVSGNAGVRFGSKQNCTLTATVRGCTFQGNRTDAVNCDAADSSTLTIGILTNTIIAGTGTTNQGNMGISASASINGRLYFNIDGNKVGTDGITSRPLGNTGINLFNGTLYSGTPALLSGTVRGNTVVNAGAGVSGCGIRVFNQGYGTIAANISGNTVSNVGLDYGLLVEVNSNSGGADATGTNTVGITGNTVNVLAGALDSIRAQARGRSVLNARINTNTSGGGGTGFRGLELRQASQVINSTTYTATVNLEGLTTGLQTVYNTIVTYLQGQNPGITLSNCDALYVTGINGVASVPGIP